MARQRRNMIDADDPRVAKIGHPAPPWLVNYADLMTELVCFFIILYALSAVLNKNVQKTFTEMQKVMKDEKIAGEVKMTKEGLRISLEETGQLSFFESGSADLSETMKHNLEVITPKFRSVLADRKFTILVEGHTDNIPIATSRFSSNWELSTARATNVVQFMTAQENLPPQSFAAVGYGEYRPIAANDTNENRAKNRRIVFLIKSVSQE
jgi:chemotaxis protein MotB